MSRAALVGFALYLASGYAVDAQEMQSSPKEFGLIGKVQSAETVRLDISTKSYRIRAGKREFVEDFGNTSAGSPDKPLLWSLLKFNAQGKLIEDIDLDRPSIEQESYRYTYTYDQSGRLIEKRGYKQDGSFDERIAYAYSPGGKKIEQLFYTEAGRISGRYNFDDHENIVTIEWYNEDGSIRRREDHRYEYFAKGNVVEQTYYPPPQPQSVGLRRLTSAATPKVNSALKAPSPQGYRNVYVYDDAGHMREENRFLPDGSLLEKKSFDENGVVRKSEWLVGDLSITTTLYDDIGRMTQTHTFAKQGFGSPRAVDDRTECSYDARGNRIEMVTRGPDGSLVSRTTTVYEYDELGNWIKKMETNLNNIWRTEPFHAAFETISEFRRTISYFPEN